MNFKELGKFSKQLQVKEYKRIYHANQLPEKDLPEIVILGKSNVGKSTLINTMLNHKISRVSKSPGCTRWLGYIRLPEVVIMDVPGYGYAKVAKGFQEFWSKMMTNYINAKRTDEVWLLIDSRRGFQEIDEDTVKAFSFCNVIRIFTKADQKGSFKQEGEINCSTKNGIGIEELRELLTQTTYR